MIDPTSIRNVGRFRVERFIAEGGFAWVFEVVDSTLGPDARRALKMLKPGTEVERFINEARQLAALNHPSLVQIYEFGRDEVTDCAYFVMTFVPGGTLSERIRGSDGRPPLAPAEIYKVFEGVLSGLAELHQRGIVHRDIKPANVLLWLDGTAVLSDLGIARVGDSRMTQTGVAMGTALYMSPEQARGRAAGPPSDVFSLGLCIYQAFERRTVYDNLAELDSSSGQEVLLYLGSLIHAQRNLEFVFDETPPALRPVIERACAIDPTERYADASAMLVDFRTALRSDTASGSLHTWAEQGDRPNWPRIALAGALTIALALFAIWSVRRFFDGGSQGPLKRAEQQRTALTELLGTLEKRLEPAPKELQGRLEESLAMSERLLQQSQSLLKTDQPEAAGQQIRSAQITLDEACATLERDYLDAQLSQARSALEASHKGLEESQAPKLLADDWHQLEKLRADALEEVEGSSACDRALAAGKRLAQLDTAQTAALGIEARVQAALEGAADEAREKAAAAKASAVAERVTEPAYVSFVEKGEQALVAGNEAVAAHHPLAAQTSYREAQGAFESAAAVVLAAHAQAAAVGKRDEVTRAAGDLGRAGETHAGADRLFQAGSYAEAAEAYRSATSKYDEILSQAKRGAGAADVRSRAQDARKRAAEIQAKDLAGTAWTSAEEKLAEGDRLRQSGDYDHAEKAYADAAAGFEACLEEVGRRKRAVLDAAAAAGDDLARLASAGCRRLESPDAVESCERGSASLEDGRKSLAADHLAEAEREVSLANVLVQKARQLEGDFDGRKAPRIVSQSPKSPTVPGQLGRTIEFSVEVAGADRERFEYAWTVGGRAATSSGPRLSVTPTEDARIEVAVSRPGGAAVTQGWNVRVAQDEAPVVSLETPKGATVAAGETLPVRATGSDREGKPLRFEFLVDGRVVRASSTQASFDFKPQRPGSYTIAVRARDPAGHTGEAQVVVSVAGAANRPPVLTLSGGAGSLEVGQRREVVARASDPDGDPVTTSILLDGKPVARGDHYTFEPAASGTYRISAVATDSKGARSQEQVITLTVGTQVVTTKPSTPPVSDPLPGIRAAIDRYSAAVKSCDRGKILDAAPSLSSLAIMQYRHFCDLCPDQGLSTTVELDRGDVQLSNDAAEANLVLYLECPATKATSVNRLKAVLQRSASGWRLTKVLNQQ